MLASLAMPATAAAAVTTSDITAPADPSRFYLETVSSLTLIEGTSDGDGTEELALWCVQGVLGDSQLQANIDVQPDGTFSTTLGPEQLELGRCRLRALPETMNGQTADLSPFTGPLVSTDAFQRSRTGSGHASDEVQVDFFVNQQQARGFGGFTSIGSCGVCGSRLFYADTELSSEFVFYVNGRLDAEVPTLSRAGARVDDHNAWGSSIGFADVEPGGSYTAASEVLAGVPPLTFSVNGADAFQQAGVDISIHEEQDLVRCRDGDPMPLAEPGCGAFVPSGVRVTRDLRQSRDGTLFELETSFTSTDAQAHALDLLWTENFFNAQAPPKRIGFQFPGNGDGYAPHSAGDTIPAPDQPTSIFVKTDSDAPDGDRRYAQGVVLYDAPVGALRFVNDEKLVVPVSLTVPATGAVSMRAVYAQGTTRAGLDAVAAEFRDAWADPPPVVGPPGPAPPGGPPALPPPLPVDVVAPTLTRVALSASRFRVAAGPTAIAAATRRGTVVRYALSEAARVSFAVARARPGRRAGGRCRRPTRANQRRARCTRFVRVGRAITRSSPAGASRLRFTGRIARRALRPGRHRMVVRAADAAGNRSKATSLRFRIVRR